MRWNRDLQLRVFLVTFNFEHTYTYYVMQVVLMSVNLVKLAIKCFSV